MEPWYPDQMRGLPKTAESRGTESVINAIVLSRRAAGAGALSADGRQGFANMWSQQMKTGDLSGAWAWLAFKLEPWEGAKSAYFGAALAAVAVGSAPGGYASSGEIEKNVELLRGYLKKNAADQHTLNKLMLLWASTKLTGLLTTAERDTLVAEVFGRQQRDGGWSTARRRRSATSSRASTTTSARSSGWHPSRCWPGSGTCSFCREGGRAERGG